MDVGDIVASIERAYGSLSQPHFGSVSQRLEEGPYRELLDALRGQFNVEDTTDPNDDHAVCLVLSSDQGNWALNLSVVGPYAAFARLDNSWSQMLTPTSRDLSPVERWVVYRLGAHNLRLLSQDQLERPVPLRLFNTSDVRVYQALFTDTEILPWDRDAHSRLGLD